MDLANTPELKFETILKQSEKAYCIKFDKENITWLPKSQVRGVDNYVYVPEWLVKDKGLKDFETVKKD